MITYLQKYESKFFLHKLHNLFWGEGVTVGQQIAPEATPLKAPLVLAALYAFVPAQLPDNITNQFLTNF